MMATTLGIPQVTEEDLLEFYTRVYGYPYQPTFHTVQPPQDSDDLGYYPDGTKRTLTDEQISIFRHSECHALLQAHKRELAAASEEGEISEDDPLPHKNSLAPGSAQKEKKDISDVSMSDGELEEEDEAEYEKFLEKERKEFEEAAKPRQMEDHNGLLEGKFSVPMRKADLGLRDRTISTRRKVREMDAVDSFDQALNYGDEDEVSQAETKQPVSEQKPQGRKIWWPTIDKT